MRPDCRVQYQPSIPRLSLGRLVNSHGWRNLPRHLKKQDGPFGRRVRIKWAEHRPFFGEPVDNALPADCKCSGYMLFGDRLHGCGIQAARGLTQGISVYDDWSTLPDPRNETCCSGCLANVKSRRLQMATPTLEWGIWNTGIGGIMSLPSRTVSKWLYSAAHRLHRVLKP